MTWTIQGWRQPVDKECHTLSLNHTGIYTLVEILNASIIATWTATIHRCERRPKASDAVHQVGTFATTHFTIPQCRNPPRRALLSFACAIIKHNINAAKTQTSACLRSTSRARDSPM